MTPKILRQLWSVIENSQTKIILQMDDASLVQWLAQQITTQAFLEPKETDYLVDYIQSRLALIRDIAYERQYSSLQFSHK